MGNLDFQTKWKETEEESAKDIIKRLLLTRVKYDFPNVVLVTGGSGEGKSETVLNIEEILLKEDDLKLVDYVDDIVVMNPLQYVEKLQPLLHEPRLKKVFLFHLDDARMVVGAENWASFLNVAIAHINSLSRSIKPLILFIVTQSIKDIDPKTRRTINWEFKCVRSRFDYVKLTPFKYWIDDHDIEKPKLKKRRVAGMIEDAGIKTKVYPILKFKRYKNKEVLDKYRTAMIEGKTKFLDKLLFKLTEKIKADVVGSDFSRVYETAEHFKKNPDILKEHGEFKRKRWMLSEKGNDVLKFSKAEKIEFEKVINSNLNVVV